MDRRKAQGKRYRLFPACRLTRRCRFVSASILFASATFLMSLSASAAEDAAAANDKSYKPAHAFNEKHYQATYKMVESLLNKSSLALASAQSPDAKSAENGEQAHDARYYFEQAKKAHQAGDKERAAEFLEKAKKAMFSAGKKAGSAKSHQQKLDDDYKKKIESAKAMLDALKRIHKEKPRGEEGVALERQIAEKIDSAEQTRKKSDIASAKQQADAAFLLAKQSVINLRDGDTLVRSLNFATKADEYKYELDRNNTHKMLVTLLLQDKMSNPDIKKRVDAKMQEAAQYRQQAEAKAAKSQFEEAVKLLEESTKYIIHAIRAAGIYIPG